MQTPTRADAYRVAALIAFSVILVVFIETFSLEKMSFLYKNVLHLNASDMGTLGIFLGIPAYLRPFMGAGSDIFPILGFHRRSYYALAFALLGISFLGLSLVHSYNLWSVAALALVVATGSNLLFVIMDAVMVTVGNATGTVSRLQTVQQFLQPVLGFSLAHLRGWVTQHWSYQMCFSAAAGVAFLGIPLALLIKERRQVKTREVNETPEQHEARMAAKREDRARASAALAKAIRSPGLWAMAAFIFYLIITPGTGYALFYYEVDSLHFSKQFIGDLGMPRAAGAIAGIALFAFASPKMPVKVAIWAAYLMDCMLYVIHFFIYSQHSAMVALFCAGVVGSIYILSLLTVAARATPKAVEGAIYGLLMASIGLAGALGEKIGSSLYEYFGPSHHYTTGHGWHWLLGIGLAFTLAAAIFIPFLPAWTRSNVPLGELRGEPTTS